MIHKIQMVIEITLKENETPEQIAKNVYLALKKHNEENNVIHIKYIDDRWNAK